jgi:hypothetical protein
MPSSEDQRLLNDVLRDAEYAAFRAEVYEMSLAEFKAGEPHPARAILMAVAAVALIAVAIALTLRTRQESPARQRAAHSVSAASATTLAILNTAPLPAADVIRSFRDQSEMLETESSQLRAIPLVQSDPATIRPLQNAELLALLTSDSLGFLRTARGDNLYYFAKGRTPWLE